MPTKTRSLGNLEQLIATAATDTEVRDALVLDGAKAAMKFAKIELDEEEVQLVAAIREDLLRFGGNPDLHPDDASSWALGVLISGTARCKKEQQWTVSVKSIQRNNATSNNNKKRRGK